MLFSHNIDATRGENNMKETKSSRRRVKKTGAAVMAAALVIASPYTVVFAENKYLAQQKGQKEHSLLSRFLLSTVRQENKSEPIQALEEMRYQIM